MLSARAAGRLAGVLSSIPPGAYPLPPPTLTVRLRCLLGQGLQVAQRWARVYEILGEHHPVERHWYLATIGVDPELRGRGVGTGLLSAWLEVVDGDPEPAYLETDVDTNLRFYERAGFAVAEELRILGVRVWTMRRPGRPGARVVESP
jgi:ribosomal protein S18 acetylase RimI-like enzyme